MLGGAEGTPLVPGLGPGWTLQKSSSSSKSAGAITPVRLNSRDTITPGPDGGDFVTITVRYRRRLAESAEWGILPRTSLLQFAPEETFFREQRRRGGRSS
jgi:hypothetical protein